MEKESNSHCQFVKENAISNIKQRIGIGMRCGKGRIKRIEEEENNRRSWTIKGGGIVEGGGNSKS